MESKVLFCCVLAVVLIIGVESAINGDCPLSSQVQTCTPKCIQDTDCTKIGGKCCPNNCNYKSCVLPRASSNSGSGYKGSTGGSGSYCGNVKCNSFEKCDLDRATKRMKCVRA